MKLSKFNRIALFNGLLLLALTLSEFTGLLSFPLILSYQWHKILHLIGVMLFMGNMIVGPVWFSYAYYSGNPVLLRFAARLLGLTDVYLTIPGIALTIINGLFLATALGGSRLLPWLYWSIILLLLMWAISIPVIFIQEKMYREIDAEKPNEERLKRLLNQWAVWGTLVTIPPSIIFYLMVAK